VKITEKNEIQRRKKFGSAAFVELRHRPERTE
jgi:hypothetical protein